MSTAPRTVARNPVLAVIALCFGGLSAALTQTLVIPIQSELPGLLGTSAANASWVVTVTLLAAAVTMPVSGRLADIFGKRRVMLVSVGILLVGSVVCALSDTLLPLLVGRGMQGMAMGFIPIGISLMREITPPEMTATATASMSATLGVGGAIGLPLAAWIADSGDWHALFWVAAGASVLVLVALLAFVPAVADRGEGRLDVVGAVGLAAGLVAFLVGLSKANEWGWTSGRTLGAVVGGILVLVLWGLFELRQSDPLVDLRTTARPAILMTNVAAVAIGFGMMAQSIVVPQLLQLPEATGFGLGQSILAAGLWMAPGGIMMLVFAPISARMIKTTGARNTLAVGALVLGLGYVAATFLMGAPWQLLIASCIATAGVGIGYAAMPTLILDAAPPREASAAVGLNALSRSAGTSIAAAVMATVLTGQTMEFGGAVVPTEGAFRLCFIIGAVAAVLGAALAMTIPRARAAARSDVPTEVRAGEGELEVLPTR